MKKFLTVLLTVFCVITGNAEPPHRIVSLAPNITETIFAMGHGGDIVGDTDFCRFPAEATTKKKVGGLFDANIEVILSLKPDIVFLTQSHGRVESALKASNVNTVNLHTETIADIYATTKRIGDELGDAKGADDLVGKMKSEMKGLEEKQAKEAPINTIFIVGYSDQGMRDIYAVGSKTFLDELMTVAGAKNVLGDSAVSYPVISREFLIAHPPVVIIDSNGGGGRPRTDEEKQIARDKWKSLFGDANPTPRVVFLDDAHVTIPGPALAESARKIHDLVREPAITASK